MKGLTLIEILVVVALLTALMGLTIPVGLRFLKNEQFAGAQDELTQTLRRAHELSRIQERDSAYGVFPTSSGYTLFKGNNYANRDPAFDEVYSVPAGITLVGKEVVFSKLRGMSFEPTYGVVMGRVLRIMQSGETVYIEANVAGRVARVANPDQDGDGWFDVEEIYIGTDALDPCADDLIDAAWPPDFDNNKTVNILDVLAIRPHLNSEVGDANYDSRYDLEPDGMINIIDTSRLGQYFNMTCI